MSETQHVSEILIACKGYVDKFKNAFVRYDDIFLTVILWDKDKQQQSTIVFPISNITYFMCR